MLQESIYSFVVLYFDIYSNIYYGNFVQDSLRQCVRYLKQHLHTKIGCVRTQQNWVQWTRSVIILSSASLLFICGKEYLYIFFIRIIFVRVVGFYAICMKTVETIWIRLEMNRGLWFFSYEYLFVHKHLLFGPTLYNIW